MTQKDQKFWYILDAVIRLEVTKGHLRWKLTDLARMSGVGRPLIYYYFGKSKNQILETALKVVGESFFGLSEERLKLWQNGQIVESVLQTRKLLSLTPHAAEFYFHWRHQDHPIADHFRSLESRYQKKIGTSVGGMDGSALFAIMMGLVLMPELSEASIRKALKHLSV